VRELSVQLWSVNQRTTGVEEVTDSEVRTKSVIEGREDTGSPVRNGATRRLPLIMGCYNWL
jgi:hypothetical protein